MKGFYETEVRRVPSYKDVIPEFPHWFIPCGKVWLLRYQKDGISFVDNAWEDDKNTFHVRLIKFMCPRFIQDFQQVS